MIDCNKDTRTNTDCCILLTYGLTTWHKSRPKVKLFSPTSLKQNVCITNVYKRFLFFLMTKTRL